MTARQTKISPGSADQSDRQRILAGARQHFLAHGFRNVTMAELAAELGMSKKTLYVHFQSKTELLVAMIDAKLKQVHRDMDAVMAVAGISFADRLQRLLAVLREQMSEIQPPFVRDLKRADPELFARIREERRKLINNCFGKLLEQGRKAGAVRADIPVKLLIEMLVGMVDTVVVPARVDELGITPRAAFAQIVAVFLEGALIRKETTK
jgi:AcrR family transcriptional regulator